MRDHRARVVGFTRGIRTLTAAPTVFTSAEQTLGLQPTPMADGLSRTLAWYKGNGV